MVIYDIRQVISRKFIRTLVKDLIINPFTFDTHISADHITDMHVQARINLKTDRMFCTGIQKTSYFTVRQRQGITHLHTRMTIILEVLHLLAFFLQFFRRIKGIIRLPLIQQDLNIFLINLTTLTLPIRSILSTKVHAFIKADTQPSERFKNIFFRPRNKTMSICVFNPKDKIALMLTGKEIIKQSSTHSANM